MAFELIAQDVRHAFRQLGKTKGFATSAAFTLALGIGASTAVFAVLDAVALRPLPFAEPDRLMAFRSLDRRGTPHPTQLSYPDFFNFRNENRVFEHLVSYRDTSFTLTDSLPAIQVPGEIVSWNLFPMLGVQPEIGRGFVPEEEKPGTHVMVLSHALWKNRFGGDKGILRRAINVNGVAFTVVGVAPADFRFPTDSPSPGLWVTLSEDTTVSDQRGGRMLDAIGRLKTGITVEQAQAQMDLVAGGLARQYAESRNVDKTLVQPELERLAGSSIKPLLILLGAVAMLLMIACANVANMLLARNAGRAREFALRTALGASRLRIVRQLLIEALALGTLATAAGILLALTALKAVLPLAGETTIPRLSQAGIDWRVLAFSIVMAVSTSVLFSLAPALRTAGKDPAGELKQGSRSIAGGNDRFRNVLVVVQMTLGLVLLAGAELLMAGFLNLMRQDPGFRPDHLLAFDIGLPGAQYNVDRQIAFSGRLLESLRAIPGVESAATGRPLPLEGHEMSVAFDIEERPAAPADRPRSDFAIVTPGYFSTMGIPLLKGRDFTERDDAGGSPVLIVNQAFARKYFPGGDAIGKRIKPGAGRSPVMREIVGVVGDAKQAPLGAGSDPIHYFAYKQLPWSTGTIVLRTTVSPTQVESAARAAVVSLDAQVPLHRIRTGEQLSAGTLDRIRFLIVLMGGFAAIALLLTGAGLYAVLSYTVARRRGEIGVRIALGAGRMAVLGMVFKQAMGLVIAGLSLGLAGALAFGKLLESALFGIRPGDPLLLAGACGVLLITSMAAAYLPALRAASVDPMQALGSE